MTGTKTKLLYSCVFALFLVGGISWHIYSLSAIRADLELAEQKISQLEEHISRQQVASEMQSEPAVIEEQSRQNTLADTLIQPQQAEFKDEAPQPVQTSELSSTSQATDYLATTSLKQFSSVNLSTSQQLEGAAQTTPIEKDESYVKGQSALARLDYIGAVHHLKQVDKTSPEFVDAKISIANVYLYLRENTLAIKEFEQVLEHAPNSVDAWIGLATAWQRQGNHVKQIQAWDKVTQLQPEQWLHLNNKAAALYTAKRYDEALAAFSRAAELAQSDLDEQANALENMGFVYLARKEWQYALDHALEVETIAGKRSWNALIQAIAALKLERFDVAEEAFDDWFQNRRLTDAFIIEEYLPAELKSFASIDAKQAYKLANPRLANGIACVNHSQCSSGMCHPGAPDNKTNYCVALGRDCAVASREGLFTGNKLTTLGKTVRCYQPKQGLPRWTPDVRNAADS